MRHAKPTLFTLQPVGPFSIDSVRDLQCGFLRGTRTCETEGEDDRVTVAFPLDETFELAAVRMRLQDRTIHAELFGSVDSRRASAQLARMLAVDHDARPFQKILDADPVLHRLSEGRPGFRPVLAASAYAMAGWMVLSQRTRMSQAARLQVQLAEACGEAVAVGGREAISFPRPQSLLRLSRPEGIHEEKWRRLQAIAAAALEGKLGVSKLSAMPYAEARASLLEIHGVGPASADGILVRGCGLTDVLPLGQPMLHGAIQLAFGLKRAPSDDEVRARAEAWRPFRTWVSVLLISQSFDRARAIGKELAQPGLREGFRKLPRRTPTYAEGPSDGRKPYAVRGLSLVTS